MSHDGLSPTRAPTPDLVRDVLGLDVGDARMRELLVAYTDVLTEIEKLRSLDLGAVQPAVIFRPAAEPGSE